jgi:hypothetical protein
MLVDGGELPAEKRLNERNRPTYYIPLSALDAKLQLRYLKQNGVEPMDSGQPAAPKALEQYTVTERKQVQFWTQLLDEWQRYRLARHELPKADADEQFVVYATVAHQQAHQELFGREFELTAATLYRRWRYFKAQDMDGLLDKRGRAQKGTSGIPPIVWDTFLSYYLDEAQHPVARCYEYTQLYIKAKHPELVDDIPHVSSFYRRIERDVPEPLKVLGREGEKAYRDRCAPYIRRLYDDMESNDYWVADTHTLDVLSDAGDGRTHRLYLVAFFDARSWMFMGCHIAEQPSSQATLIALRKAIRANGIPVNIYVDNGREFLTRDVGGLGHRQTKKQREQFNPPPVFERLGITMVNALVRNARAKVIERRFRDVKDHLSRLFPTYTGGNVVERPEQLKYNLKKGKIVADQELTSTVETLLEFYFNRQPYGGSVAKDRGKPRTQVYNENLHTKRMASEEDLNLMMMRSSRVQQIGRRGVSLKIGDVQFDYFNDFMLNALFGEKVYYRYDPEDLSEVRVYDLEDRLLTIAPVDNETIQKYGASKDDLEPALKRIRSVERAQKVLLENSGLPEDDRISALALLMDLAAQNEQDGEPVGKGAKVLHLHRPLEQPLFGQAIGFDIDAMLEGAIKHHKGGNNDE